ncbi:MAG: hypothetical protein QNL01_11915 [Akkermansiaceae bacterium]|jgi:hypothetical protein|tara:strand:+ start:5169 stop:5675 length:507 start_codon:yes stop_codon:yes gene_type:complete
MKTKFFVLIALGVATTPARRLPSTLIQWVPVPSGTTVTAATPLTVNGAGYGDVKFEVANADSLIVAANHQNGSGTNMNSLELDAGEIVWVTFLGPQALNVSFDIIGINNGESATPVYIGSGGDIHQLEAIGGNGVGTAAITWDAVPTPSSSLLVLVGSGSLILRRRRG